MLTGTPSRLESNVSAQPAENASMRTHARRAAERVTGLLGKNGARRERRAPKLVAPAVVVNRSHPERHSETHVGANAEHVVHLPVVELFGIVRQVDAHEPEVEV